MPQGYKIDDKIKKKCVEMRGTGMEPGEIFETYYTKVMPKSTRRTFMRNLLNWAKEAPTNKKHIALENFVPNIRANKWDGTQTIRFGLLADPHINSKYTQLTWLHSFYDILAEQEISIAYNAGDITEGEHMRKGHEYELYRHGADEQVSEIARVYPKRAGIETHFITGNHDSSIYRVAGCDIGKALAKERKDMIYLGRDCAVVNLTPNCTLELRHPWNGTAYAMSYHPQKIIESMEADSKPNVLAIGHYHKAIYMFYRNIHCFCAGCFQSQTPFMRGKGLAAHMGGWIVTARVDENGYLQSFDPQYIPYYYPIKDDYKNFEANGQKSSNEYQ